MPFIDNDQGRDGAIVNMVSMPGRAFAGTHQDAIRKPLRSTTCSMDEKYEADRGIGCLSAKRWQGRRI